MADPARLALAEPARFAAEKEELIPAIDMVRITVTEATDKELKRSDKVLARNAKVWADIEKRGKRVFTVPGVSSRTKLDSRRTKRAIDHFIDEGKVIISKKGFKSRATRYKAVKME